MRLSSTPKATGLTALLAFVGSFAVAVGVYLAVMTMIHTPLHHPGGDFSARGAVYVGGNTCFTCHDERNSDWSFVLDAQPAATPMANPQVMLVDVRVHQPISHPNTSSVTAELPTSDDMLNHAYIIATEDEHVPLPGEAAPSVPLDEGLSCGDCHAAQVVSLRLKPA